MKSSRMFSEVLLHFGLKNIGGNFRTLKQRLEFDKIDYSHIPQGLGANRGRSVFKPEPIPYDKLFTQNSRHSRSTVKRRIILDKLLEYKCIICGLDPVWNNKPLTLILDHKNGIRDDHRMENLRFICPNCDIQNDTFGSKNIMKKHYNCESCGIHITKHSKSGLCRRCNDQQRKVFNRPSKEDLENMVDLEPITRIAKRYGITDKAVHKWCRSYNIRTKGVGYWSKLHAAKV